MERPRDLQRGCRQVLAGLWMLDGLLQFQGFMFTGGFASMLKGQAVGNPGWVSRSITSVASLVGHHPVATNTSFALVQLAIGLGIATRWVKPALAGSIVWSLLVWWFGEGLGGVLAGRGTPLGGGPGAVLFYGLLAVVLWPREGTDDPFVAARTVGEGRARWIWTAVWGLLAMLAVVGRGRNPGALAGIVTGTESGQPGWLAHVDAWSASLLARDGMTVALAAAAVSIGIGAAVWLSPRVMRVAVVAAIAGGALIWVAVENLGGIPAGGATDPNSGPLLIVMAAAWWPIGLATEAGR